MNRAERIEKFREIAKERILIFDGAWGTMIQDYGFTEDDFRNDKFQDHPCDLKGNNDILSISRPEALKEIARAYMEAGADIILTNTFSSTEISQADYECEPHVHEINLKAAQINREAADKMTEETPDKPRFVAGSIGPTNKTLSLSPDVNRPEYREISYDYLKDVYKAQARALAEGEVDFFVVETIFDTLNAKAAIAAIMELEEETGEHIPTVLSGTITDKSGRTLSGQTVEAFWHSIRHVKPLMVGLNCALGAEDMEPFLADLSRAADCLVHAYPNAGLPNEMGEYDESPEAMSEQLGRWAKRGLINAIGGCCGTTPDHIRAIAEAVGGHSPRSIPEKEVAMRLSGLEPFTAAA